MKKICQKRSVYTETLKHKPGAKQLYIVLLTPRRRFIVNRLGLGYQMPLGLILIGGPLLDAGHRVELLDNDVLGLDDDALAQRLAAQRPDCVFIGHTASTAAHPEAMGTARVLRRALPTTWLVYGGVFASFAARTVLEQNPALDGVVRGEGEATVLELASVIASAAAGSNTGGHPAPRGAGRRGADLTSVRGISWRRGSEVVDNPGRPPQQDLDRFRPGWELADLDRYQLFGFGRAAGHFFSRGCQNRCSFCGQWAFWRRWRHRSVKRFVDELEQLQRQHGVGIVWLADENFAANRDLAQRVLEAIVARGLTLSLNINMTAADVVAQADLLPLYKQAGVDNVSLGLESLDDGVVDRIGKANPRSVSRRAVSLLRSNNIVSVVNLIYGLERESPRSLWRNVRRLLRVDPDVLNAEYLTPHFWTAAGRSGIASQLISGEQRYFTYRNQVLATPGLSPLALFIGVKLTEALVHLRPRALWRVLRRREPRARRLLRAYLGTGIRVWLGEIAEFARRRFVAAGSLAQIPGAPLKQSAERLPAGSERRAA